MLLETPVRNQENTSENSPATPDFADLLDAYDYESPERGQILDGTILEADTTGITLDVGLKRDAVVSRRELDEMDDTLRDTLTPGKTVQAWVVRPYSYDGELVVSIKKAMELEDWQRAIELMDSSDVVPVTGVGQNKGGLLVRFGRLQGFIPNSHLTGVRRSSSADALRAAKQDLFGETLYVKVIEVNRRQDRLVMSEREAEQVLRMERMAQLEVGTIVEGRVVHLVDFGAFVDIGGVEGLLHVSKIAHHHVPHPRDILSVGDSVTVKITEIDLERGRISLDRRAILPDPWDTFVEQYEIGDLVTGTVTNVVDFGAFVAVPGGAQGLAHVNNMQQFGTGNPHDMLREGDEVLVRIVDIDYPRQRISLSFDDVTVDEQEAWMRERVDSRAAESEEPEDEVETEAEAAEETSAELDAEPVEEADETEAAAEETESPAQE